MELQIKMIPQARWFPSSNEVDGRLPRPARGAGRFRCAHIFTHPTLVAPRRALSQVAMAISSSGQARLYILLQGGLGCFQLRELFSPTRPCARLDVRFPKRAPRQEWSFQASLVAFSRSSLDQSKRARVKEHRLFNNTIGLVCAFREHKD